MTKDELFTVLEALKSAHTELETLIEEDVHIPSGHLMEQLEEAIELVEGHHAEQ